MYKESLLDTFPFWKTNLNITNWQPATVAQTAVSWKQMLLASKKNNNRIPTSSARRRSLIPIRSVSFRSKNKMRLLDLLSLSCLHLLWSFWNLIVVSLFLLAACRTPQSVDRRVYFRVVRFKIFGCSCRSWFKFWLCRTKKTRREIHSLGKETRGKT